MKQNANRPEYSLTMSVLVVIFSATLLAFAGTTAAQGKLYFYFYHMYILNNYIITLVSSHTFEHIGSLGSHRSVVIFAYESFNGFKRALYL